MGAVWRAAAGRTSVAERVHRPRREQRRRLLGEELRLQLGLGGAHLLRVDALVEEDDLELGLVGGSEALLEPLREGLALRDISTQSTLKSLLPFSTFSREKREIHFFKSKKSRALGSLSSAEYSGTIMTFW